MYWLRLVLICITFGLNTNFFLKVELFGKMSGLGNFIHQDYIWVALEESEDPAILGCFTAWQQSGRAKFLFCAQIGSLHSDLQVVPVSSRRTDMCRPSGSWVSNS